MRWWWWRAENRRAQITGEFAARAREEAEKKIDEVRAKDIEVRETINRSQRIRTTFFTEYVQRVLGGNM